MRSLASALRGLFLGRGKEDEGNREAEVQDEALDEREAEEREAEEREREREAAAAAAIEEEMRAEEREAEAAERGGSEKKELKAELGEAQLGTLRFSSLSRSRSKGACGCWRSLSPSLFASCDEAATAAAVERAMGVCARCAAEEEKKNETEQWREKQPQCSELLPDAEGGESLGLVEGEANESEAEMEEEEWQTQLWLMQESEALRFRLVLSLTRPRQMAVAERHFLGVARPLDPLSAHAAELRERAAHGGGVSAEEEVQQRLQCCCYILEVRNVREEAYVGSSTSRSATASGLEDLKLAAVIELSSAGVGLNRSARRVHLLLLTNEDDGDGDTSRRARLLPSRCLPLALERTADAAAEP